MKRFQNSIFIMLLLPMPMFADWNAKSDSSAPYYNVVNSGVVEMVIFFDGKSSPQLEYSLNTEEGFSVFRYDGNDVALSALYHVEGGKVVIDEPLTDSGYYIERDGAIVSAVWLVDYSGVRLEMRGVSVDEDNSDCDYTRLLVDHDAPEIQYFIPAYSGPVRKTLDRGFTVEYATMVWDEESKSFVSEDRKESFGSLKSLVIDAPLCQTGFKVTGDNILQYWNQAESVESDTYQAVAVDGRAFASQIDRGAGNELDESTAELGGSAPVLIDFSGYANQPVVTYMAWEVSDREDFSDIIASYPEQNLSYTIMDEGVTYVRFVVSNADASCEKVIETFSVTTSESMLQVPNVFTPGSSSGENQIFKVVYRSIVKFDARVFNRWGNELFHWTDPSQGWDGTHRGKLVPTGAYYYVITADGVGGKRYNLKGDINVLRTNN